VAAVYLPLLRAELPSRTLHLLLLIRVRRRLPFKVRCEGGQERSECNDPGFLLRLTLQRQTE
jgi:hypothetical protein